MNKAKTVIIVWSVLLVQVLAGTEAQARFYPDARVSLKGLPGVFLVVEDITPQAERDGLTRRLIRGDVAARLGRAGVKLLSRAQWVRTPGRPMLSVIVAAYKSKFGFYGVYLSVRLRQVTLLQRDPAVATATATWSSDFLVVVRSGQLSNIRRKLTELIDHFIQAYWAVNPRRQ
ncbi:MAG: hypothetical protein KJ621_11330 [Proteobacteria bacterium]|nr:hypothetical protein [Pseudomonadota bacterium]